MVLYGFPQLHVAAIVTIASSVLEQFPTGHSEFDVRKTTFLMCQVVGREDTSVSSSILLWLLYYTSLHSLNIAQYSKQLASPSQNEIERSVVDRFLAFEGIVTLSCDISKEHKPVR
jgi:hypothetical protein